MASGLIGGLTTTWLMSHSTTCWDNVEIHFLGRPRKGPIVKKQWNRLARKHNRLNRKPDHCHPPPVWNRQNYRPHPRFNNIGRDHRAFNGPTIEQLRGRIESLTAHVKELNRDHWRLSRRMNLLEERLIRVGSFGTPREGSQSPYPTTPTCSMARTSRRVPHGWNIHHDGASQKNPGVPNGDEPRRSARGRSRRNGRTMTPTINRSPTERLLKKGEVLFDSGANCCITFDRTDFTTFEPGGPAQVDGLGKGLRIEGTGTIKWTFLADDGTYRTLASSGVLRPVGHKSDCLYSDNIKRASRRNDPHG